ncbi:DNA/RNA non-specific endonuclease [Treponema endosymbiont of Eucomonympha sp.]|uniref:DNA/RNA non-specific endonuclease n=1 Tax=Treponema endosymbiont of Eucomonympha sp. TaxID=1580831 RepID=UPI000780A99B|nr:DNA/RNA non-specific endonuclease [Treponema endosymbiont of Eucomonympha sp.]
MTAPKKRRGLPLLLCLCMLAPRLFAETPAGTVPYRAALPPRLEIPKCAASCSKKLAAKDHEMHAYEGFALCYRESFEEAEWVAYELTPEKRAAAVSRGGTFISDPAISTGSASPADYVRSGYDRGHLAPAADMRYSERAMRESFYMSNITPQTPECNRGVWAQLERAVRAAAARGRAWVISGPVLDKTTFPRIGENNVAVPEYHYKAVLLEVSGTEGERALTAVGFIVPNRNPGRSYMDYACTVDEVERRTGLDFFSALRNREEKAVERVFLREPWQQTER